MDITNEDSVNISFWDNDDEELPRPETVTVLQDELIENSDPCSMQNSDPLSVDPLCGEQINKLREPMKKDGGHVPKVIVKIEIDSDGETDAPSQHVPEDDGYRSDSDEGTTSKNKSKTSHLNDAQLKSNEVAANELGKEISEKINAEVEIGISANEAILEAEKRPQCSGVSETQTNVRTGADRRGADVESAYFGGALVCDSEVKDSQSLCKRGMKARRYATHSGRKWNPPKEKSAQDARLLPSSIVSRSVRVVIARCKEAERLVAPMALARQCLSGRKANNVARTSQSGPKLVDENIMNSMENPEIEVTEKIPKFIISKTAKDRLKTSECMKNLDVVPFSSRSGLSKGSREETLDGKQEQNLSADRDQLENYQKVGRSVSITRESLLDVSNEEAVFRSWSCSICHKEFNNPKAMSGHTGHCKRKQEKKNILPYSGKGCEKILSREATLLRPRATHKVNLKYECHICGDRFVDLSNLKEHSQTHSAEHTYTCEVCEQIFSSEESLTLHETEVGHKKNFMKNENCLSRHTNSQKQNHKCGLCGMSFGAPIQLKTHKCSFIKPNMTKNISQPANSFDKYSCFRNGRGLKVTIKRSTTKYMCNIKFFCRICMKIFPNSAALKTHMQQHTGKPIQCPVCDKTVSSSSRLQEHIRAWHTFERPYQCNLCDKAYSGANSLRIHKKFKHKLKGKMQMKPCFSSELEKCDIKHDKLVQKENGKSDFKYWPKENTQKCNECSVILSSYTSLRRHYRRFHTKQKSRCYKCDHCQASFSSLVSLRKHIAYHVRNRQNMSALKSLSHKKPDQNCAPDGKDLQVTVTSPAAENTFEKKYCCAICKTTFLNLHDWEVHSTLHIGNRCHLCDKTFSGRTRLKDHISFLHHQERPYQCNLCDKAYCSSDTLRVHKKQHKLKSYSILNSCSTVSMNKSDIMHDQLVQKEKKKNEKSNFEYQSKEKIHKCDECGRTFSTRGYLRRHNNRYHLQKRKKESLELYKCEQCKASFYSFDALSQHNSRFHSENKGISEIKSCSKEKPYRCTYCNVSYSYQIYLLKHLSKNHWEKEKEIGKSYKCNMCNITFSNSALLHRHKLSFHSDKSGGYECNNCNFVFTSRLTLLRHTRRFHPEKVKDLSTSHPRSKRKCYKCNKCNSIFNLRKAWLKHTCYSHLLPRMEDSKNKTCTSRIYQCHLCPKTLSRIDALRRHIREVHFKVKGKQRPLDIGPHSSEEIHKCKKCNATFNLAAALFNHKCSHQTKEIEVTAAFSSFTNGQIYKCDVCNVVFNQQSSLLEHTVNFHEEVTKKAFPIDVHKDEKFYKCDLCAAKYNNRKGLMNHKTKYHLKGQSYQCSVCLKSFSSPIVLIKHHETHLKTLISSEATFR